MNKYSVCTEIQRNQLIIIVAESTGGLYDNAFRQATNIIIRYHNFATCYNIYVIDDGVEYRLFVRFCSWEPF